MKNRHFIFEWHPTIQSLRSDLQHVAGSPWPPSASYKFCCRTLSSMELLMLFV